MGDELRAQSWIFDMFISPGTYRSRPPLSQNCLELKFGLSSDFSEFVTKHMLKSFLVSSFVCLGFLKRLLMP